MPSEVQLVLFVSWETSIEQSQGVYSISDYDFVGNYLVLGANREPNSRGYFKIQ